MIITDRMGGFISAKIIRIGDVDSFSVQNQKVTIIYKSGKLPIILENVKNGITISISSQQTKAGMLYSISGQIEIKKPLNTNFFAFNKFLIIITNSLNEKKVIGSPTYPLSFSTQPITPSTPADAHGELLKFNGKSAYYPFLYLNL